MVLKIYHWFDRNILELGRELRLSYLPPLMVYMAAGISSLTAIVGTFFVKDYLGLTAEFLAALAFWYSIPWALKMPLGHLVDLMWRFKSVLVFVGAGLITISLLIMIALLTDPEAMRQIMPAETWYVISVLLAPVGYVVQDVVADAMTVEAVPHVDEQGNALPQEQLKLMHTTMQTLGRVAIIGGGIFVALLNVILFNDVNTMSESEKLEIYVLIYQMALTIPVISVLGVSLGLWLKYKDFRKLLQNNLSPKEAWHRLNVQTERPHANWWILGGSLVFVIFTLTLGVSDYTYNQEIIFGGSMAIVGFLIYKLVQELDSHARQLLIGTALVIFVFRAIPGPGPGQSWWMIDELAFDQQFLSVLSLIGSSLTLLGMFIFRRFMAERSISYIVGFLAIAGAVLYLPIVGMYYGLHVWTASVTGGIVDARFIAVVDTALESPLGQIAMIPMLAWIANSAPAHLKATFFAVMASFSNLALSASQLGTKYLNKIYTISREVKNPETGAVTTPADYSDMGILMITVIIIGLIMPFASIMLVRALRWKTA